MTEIKDKFKFSTNRLDLLKAETDDYFEVEGLASTDSKDLEDEIVKQNFDLTAIKANKGYINDDHGREYSVKEHSRLGVIDEAEVRPEGLWIKGKIWKKHPAALAYYNELKHKPGMVQFSVEGYTVKRNPFQRHVVEKAAALGVALTRNPVNSDTFAQLAKSLTAGAQQETSGSLSHEQLIKGFAISSNPESAEVTITQTLNPMHPNWNEYQNQLLDLAKGGMGSGRAGMHMAPVAMKEREAHLAKQPVAELTPKTVVVEPKQQEDDDPKAGKKNPFEAQQRRRQELQAETTRARETGDKDSIKRIKKKTERFSTRKRVVKKSKLQEELLKRSQRDPLFKSKLEKILSKALASGGPAYSNTLPGDFSNGQVFQTESLNSHAKDKKCKKCKNKGPDCKCK